MQSLNAFRDLTEAGSRLGFFTWSTRDEIPTEPGCYGWYLPLWLLRDSLPEFLAMYGAVLTCGTRPPVELRAKYSWDAVAVTLRRELKDSTSDSITSIWNGLYANPHTRDALQQILLQASVLLPPLYVGKTDNLRRRYNEHTDSKSSSNTFSNRFAESALALGLSLDVSELIFVSIRTGREAETVLSKTAGAENAEDLLEEILKRLCRPPFSDR